MSARYPVHEDLDGDFTLERIWSLTGRPTAYPMPVLESHIAATARRESIWRLGQPTGLFTNLGTNDDNVVLHAFETSLLWRPPVAVSTRGLTPTVADRWLTLATHWIALSTASGDQRFLNAACKLLGAVWMHYRSSRSEPGWLRFTPRLAIVAYHVGAASDQLSTQLRNRPAKPTAPDVVADLELPDGRRGPPSAPPSVVVLAGAGSAGATRFLATAASTGLPVTAVCWYAAASPTGQEARSNYADAWYPPQSAPLRAADVVPGPVARSTASTWDAVAEVLRRHVPDLVVLLGMPIVPATVLNLASLGFINAHNGSLPQYRGMDAPAWALLNDDPIVCTLHLARPAVDRGEILACAAVQFAPAGTLRSRVKTTQLNLLLAATRHVTATGRLPDATAQPEHGGRQYYRMHPHLKRILDTFAHRNG